MQRSIGATPAGAGTVFPPREPRGGRWRPRGVASAPVAAGPLAAREFAVRRIVTLLVVVALALGGCSFSDLTDDRTPKLDGTPWSVTGWTVPGVDPVPFRITVLFQDGRVSGRSGVNRYSGAYGIGPSTTFFVGELVTTEMAGPPEAMDAEQTFRTLLTSARTYRREGGVLILGDETGKPLLVLTPLPD